MEKLILIDGNSVLYRAFYATPYFATEKGLQTNAVYGFTSMLLKIINEISPSHLLVAFDRKEPTFRHIMYKEYKGTRKPMPDELIPQVSLIKDVLKELHIATYERAGLEADDIIGTLAKKFKIETIIITGDKDSFQLVDETTSVYFTRHGITDYDVYSADNFKEKTSIEPIQIIDLKACMGDHSDNIPGIPGIGEKSALNLVSTYGSIENLYENIDSVKGKLKEKIISGKDSAFMSKTLATINTTADIDIGLSDMILTFPFPYSARKIFFDLQFATFLKKNIFLAGSDEELLGDESEEFRKIKELRVKIDEIMSDIITFDSEIYSLYFDKNIYLYDGKKEYEFIIKDNFFDKGVMFDDALDYLKPILSGGEKVRLILFDKKKIRHMLSDYNIDILTDAEDVMLQKYIVDFTQKEMTFKELVERAEYSYETPAYSLWRIYEDYEKKLKEEDSEKIYRDIELPLCDVLYEMEKSGFKVDRKALDNLSELYKEKCDDLLRRLKELAGCSFNPNSTKQLGNVLFEKLGLPHGKKTKSGYSTGAEVLAGLENEHPIVPLLIEYRKAQKLLSTYIDGFKPLIDRNTGLIHTVFNQAVTSTGRLSSKEPNLQNIPVREEEGRELRKFFIPRSADRLLVGADYSQIELRLLADFSNCSPLIQAFKEGKDVHSLTASQVFGVGINEVMPEQRRSAKAVNFGIIYGISSFGLSQNLKISPKTAGEYINKYFEMYPEIKEYMEKSVELAKEKGYAITYFGRRRNIPELKSANHNIRSFGERAAMNMPLQGTAADIIKIAMKNVFERLKKEAPTAELILQIHDELIIDAEAKDEKLVRTILKEEMENAVKLSVPLTVNVSSGKTWYDAK